MIFLFYSTSKTTYDSPLEKLLFICNILLQSTLINLTRFGMMRNILNNLITDMKQTLVGVISLVCLHTFRLIQIHSTTCPEKTITCPRNIINSTSN